MVGSDSESGMSGLLIIQTEIGIPQTLSLRGLDEDEINAILGGGVKIHHPVVARDIDTSDRVSLQVDIRGGVEKITPGLDAGEHQGEHDEGEDQGDPQVLDILCAVGEFHMSDTNIVQI